MDETAQQATRRGGVGAADALRVKSPKTTCAAGFFVEILGMCFSPKNTGEVFKDD